MLVLHLLCLNFLRQQGWDARCVCGIAWTVVACWACCGILWRLVPWQGRQTRNRMPRACTKGLWDGRQWGMALHQRSTSGLKPKNMHRISRTFFFSMILPFLRCRLGAAHARIKPAGHVLAVCWGFIVHTFYTCTFSHTRVYTYIFTCIHIYIYYTCIYIYT